MVTKEEMNEIVLRENEKRLNISRVPKNTKEIFIQIATDEFAGDYGLLLKTLVDSYLEYLNMKSIFLEDINMKLDLILNNLNSEEKSPVKTNVKTFGERRRELKGGEDNE